MQVDIRELVQELLWFKPVFLWILHLQVSTFGPTQLLQVKVQHSSQPRSELLHGRKADKNWGSDRRWPHALTLGVQYSRVWGTASALVWWECGTCLLFLWLKRDRSERPSHLGPAETGVLAVGPAKQDKSVYERNIAESHLCSSQRIHLKRGEMGLVCKGISSKISYGPC